jgi:hypothetical protein
MYMEPMACYYGYVKSIFLAYLLVGIWVGPVAIAQEKPMEPPADYQGGYAPFDMGVGTGGGTLGDPKDPDLEYTEEREYPYVQTSDRVLWPRT